MSRIIRSAVLVVVLANLVASAAFAQPRASRPAPAQTEILAAAWQWLTSFLAPAGSSEVGNLEKAGSRMDPDGLKGSTIYSGSTTDAGSSMDPNGLK
jgi:hypothetical protein